GPRGGIAVIDALDENVGVVRIVGPWLAQLDALAVVRQLTVPWTEDRNVAGNLMMCAETAQGGGIRNRIEADNQNESARGNGSALREVEIDRVAQPPGVRGNCGIEKIHAA